VSAEISFVSQIATIKRRIVIQTVHRILLLASLIFLSISAFFLVLARTGIADYPIKGRWCFVAIGFSMSAAAALFFCMVRRSNLLTVLIAIDRRLKLQDRLSTAYEYFKSKKRTGFTDLLLNDAASKIGQISTRQLVPARFSLMHLLVIILLTINIFLYPGFFYTSASKTTEREVKLIDNAQKLLNNYSISRIENKAVRKSNSQIVYAQKLKQISNQLGDGSKPFGQRFAAVNRFLKEVQGERAHLANELGAKLGSAGIKELPTQKFPDPSNLSSSQMEKLRGLLSRTLNSRMPDSIDKNIESLQELERVEKLLARIVDDLKDGRSSIDDITGSGVKERRMSQSTDWPDNPSDALNRPPQSEEKLMDHRPIAVKQGTYPHSGESGRNGDDLRDGMGRPEGYSASAGRGRSKEENNSGYDLENTPGVPLQDKVAPSQAKSYLIQIRALTDTGEARLKEEEIFQTYRKAVESVLQKEEIPLNYREYIKNYFMSIEIITEENAP
jgi:hypothetical protein